MEPIRVLDIGLVPPVRSQAIYHGVAYALGPGTPDTVILVGPTDPYVCIGYHQELEKEVDVDYCRQAGLPIYRREVGGGAVYLDRGQVFTQWIFHRPALPAALEERFALYVQPLVETYQGLGIPANHRPVNDIHVQGKKIGGTGAAQIGEAEVVVGSLMFDFNFDLMARVLKVPSEKMRDKIFQSLNEYMTTMTRQLGHTPDYAAVKREYVRHVVQVLGRPAEYADPTPAELAATAEIEARLASDEWLYQKGGLRQTGAVKIHADVYLLEATYKSPGGLIRATARLRDGRIDDLSLSGDFTLLPAFAVGALEQALRGVALEGGAVRARVAEFYRSLPVQSPGVGVEDWVSAVMAIKGQMPVSS
ncbi:MAG: lipoate--protein ligase family protein [Anaerolineales bacterium]|nr:lipoate--protein ligase family protein [Anaerolineales bacterium]